MRQYILIVASVWCLTGCIGSVNIGGSSSPAQTEAQTTIQTETAAQTAGTVNQPAQTTAEETKGMTGMPNPMKKMKSLEELQETLQFPMLTLPDDYKAHDFEYLTISDTLGQVECEVGEHDVQIRKKAGSEDITGVYGMEVQDGTYQGVTYHYGISEYDEEPDEMEYTARWEYDGYSYAVEVSEVTEEEFLRDYLFVLIDRSMAAAQ